MERRMSERIREEVEKIPLVDTHTEKVVEGYLTADEAITLARRILRDNPAALFKLSVPS